MNLLGRFLSVLIFIPMLFLTGCLFEPLTTTDPYFELDHETATAILPENAAIVAGTQYLKIWKKPGFRAVYETENYDNIMFLKRDDKYRDGQVYLVQARSKVNGINFYFPLLDRGPAGKHASVVSKFTQGRSRWMPYAIYLKELKDLPVLIDRKKEKTLLNPDAKTKNTVSFNYKMAASNNVAYKDYIFEDWFFKNLTEILRLYSEDASPLVVDSVRIDGRPSYFFYDLDNDEDFALLSEIDEKATFERYASDLVPQIGDALLKPMCLRGSASFKISTDTAVFNMDYHKEGYCSFFTFNAEMRFSVGRNLKIENCQNGICEITAYIQCAGTSGLQMNECRKFHQTDQSYRGLADIRSGRASLVEIE